MYVTPMTNAENKYNLPTATFVSPGRSISVKLTTVKVPKNHRKFQKSQAMKKVKQNYN